MHERRQLLILVVAIALLLAAGFAGGYLIRGDGDATRVSVRGGGSGDFDINIDGRVESGEGPDVVGQALNQILEQAVNPPSEESLVQGAIRGMVKVLKKQSDDPYALFYTPTAYKDFQELTTGKFSGIGVWVEPQQKDFVIVSVLPETPAQDEGLKAGDVIRTIEGRSVRKMTADEAVGRIKGPAGSDVTIGVERGEQRLEFTITRASIELPNLKARVTDQGFGYIRLFGFARGAGTQVRDEVERLIGEGVTGIVLDMRDNGGGLFSEGIEVASVFIEDGDVVIYRESKSNEIVYEAEGDAFEDIPLVVLVNERTASASEIVAGALQDNDRGVVVGSRTYGKGSVQQIVPLINSSALKLTTAAYLTPDGTNIDGHGIDPDIEVAAGPGAQRARALEILRGISVSSSGSQG